MARGPGSGREGLFSASGETDEELTTPPPNCFRDEPPLTLRGSVIHLLWANLPFAAMLGLALIGIALSSFGAGSLNVYWEIVTTIYCVLCISSGWPHAEDASDRTRLVWTQALHWAAFFVTMHLVSSANVRVVESNTAIGIDQMAILALGTFVAGVHARAWQICMVGILLAASVPAMAWVERSAMLVILVLVLVGFIVATFWWARRSLGRSVAVGKTIEG